jgi:hypothetical protein
MMATELMSFRVSDNGVFVGVDEENTLELGRSRLVLVIATNTHAGMMS